MSDKTLGQIGYDAYAASTGGKTFDGRDMPTWQQILEREGATPKVTKAWEDAVSAMANASLMSTMEPGTEARYLHLNIEEPAEGHTIPKGEVGISLSAVVATRYSPARGEHIAASICACRPIWDAVSAIWTHQQMRPSKAPPLPKGNVNGNL